jgi:hypothetical protein
VDIILCPQVLAKWHTHNILDVPPTENMKGSKWPRDRPATANPLLWKLVIYEVHHLLQEMWMCSILLEQYIIGTLFFQKGMRNFSNTCRYTMPVTVRAEEQKKWT